jgi:hypothetical protein
MKKEHSKKNMLSKKETGEIPEKGGVDSVKKGYRDVLYLSPLLM